ncbi:MAG TPA: right-handed parallel beta-helix repeat-containing protein, partial [Terriglobales bacterium]|nr:right-handed parallel beta-helix repeat-containing protein [Terriglobales bacterium]
AGRRRRWTAPCGALFLCLGLTATPGFAATFFVRAGGSDSADGTTPATAFRTIGKAAASLLNAGDVVVVGPGTYGEANIGPRRSGAEGRPIVFRADRSGAETGDPPGAVMVRPPPSQSTGFLVLGHRHIVIEGFTVRGGADAGIQIRSSAPGTAHAGDVVVRDCDVQESAKRGIDVVALGPVQVIDNTVLINGSGGIAVVGVEGRGGPFTISGNGAEGNAGAGIFVDRAAGGVIAGNRVLDNDFIGIQVRRSVAVSVDQNIASTNGGSGIRIDVDPQQTGVAEDFQVSNNLLEDNADAGLAILGGGTVRVETNTIRRSGGTGLSIDSSGIPVAATVRDNTVLGNGADGIAATGIEGGNFSSNVTSGNRGTGLRVRRGSALIVSGNTAENNDQTGIDIGSGDGPNPVRVVSVRANSVRENGGTGINVAGREQIQVADNVLQRNLGAGIAIGGDAGSVVITDFNRVDAARAEGILVSQAATILLRSNDVSGSLEAGVRLSAIGAATVIDNQVRNGSDGGILIGASGAVELRTNEVRNNAGVGMLVQGLGTAMSAAVSSNRVEGGDSHAIVVSAANGGTVSQNQITSSGGSGVLLEQSTGMVLVGNNIADVAINGVDLRATSGAVVVNNTIDRSSGNGILAQLDGGIRLTGNTVRRSVASGIEIVPITAGASVASVVPAVASNILSQNGTGIFVDAATAGSLADNTVTDSSSDGILVHASRELSITGNRIERSGRNGIAVGNALEPAGSGILVRDNLVVASGINPVSQGGAGLVSFVRGDQIVRDNEVIGSSSSGISAATRSGGRLLALDNVSGDNGAVGMFLLGPVAGRAQSNVLFSNADSGLQLRDSVEFALLNNLIYRNTFDGIAIGGPGAGSPDTTVASNTIVANDARGINIASDSPRAVLLNNIIQDNPSAVAIADNSIEGLVSGFNLRPAAAGEMRARPYDILMPASFVDPDGADGVLGGSGFADDDFRLQQVRGGQASDSAGVDAGSAAVEAIGLAGSTASGDLPDVGRLDVGFHYGTEGALALVTPEPFMPLYVRVSGTAGNDGLTPGRALDSIRAAGMAAAAGMAVVVGPGIYENDPLLPISVRASAGRVTFFADSSGKLTGDDAGDVIVDAAGGENGFLISGADDITVQGFHVTNAFDAGIQVRNDADRARIFDNIVFSNERRGVEVRDSDEPEILNNLIYANGTGGLHVEQSRGAYIANNTIFGNGAVGLLVGATPATVGSLIGNPRAGSAVISIALSDGATVAAGEEVEIGAAATRYTITSVTLGTTTANLAISPALTSDHMMLDTVVVMSRGAAPDSTVIR